MHICNDKNVPCIYANNKGSCVSTACIRLGGVGGSGGKGEPVVVVVDETNAYDRCEIIEGCTVEILTNTMTGETSVGWWRGGIEDRPGTRRIE